MELRSDIYRFELRREFLLSDLLRSVRSKRFHPRNMIKVRFVGEVGRDTGGLTREMWRLFAKELRQMCEGRAGCLMIKHDATKLKEGVFRKIGMLIGISLVQGGSGFPFFAPSTYQYLWSKSISSVIVGHNEMPHNNLDEILDKLISAEDDSQLRDIALDSFDGLLTCCFRKPIALLTRSDILEIIECVVMHTCIYERKAELDEMILALEDAGVLEMMHTYPFYFQPLFVEGSCKVCADDIMRLFGNKVFSEAGTNDLRQEQTTYILFKDFLEEMEENEGKKNGKDDPTDGVFSHSGGDQLPSVGDCLAFFTGTDRRPYPTYRI